MRAPRRWLIVLACGVAVLGALFGALFLPSVQRHIVMRLFPTDAGKSLEFQGLAVGVGHTHVRDLRLDWNGLKVAIGEADLRYGFFDVLTSKTARVDLVRVRSLVVDARSIVDQGQAAADDAGEPFRFEGLRPLARLPVRCVLSEIDVDAELLVPAAGGATARLHAVLTGRNVAPGATGELKADVGVSLETADGVKGVLAGTGAVRVHESDEGVFDVLEFQGEVHPADKGARKGAGLSARAGVDLTATDETYRVVFATSGTAARELLDVDAKRRASDGHVAGSWTARLDAGQVDPYISGFAPPEFALTGDGTFDVDAAELTAATASRFEVSASRWDRIHEELAAIGPLRFDAEVAADFAGPRIDVRSLSARVAPAGQSPVLEIGADQPFAVDTKARTFQASLWGAPLAHLRLIDVPAVWWGGSGTGVAPLSGTMRGALELTASDAHTIRVRSTEPLALAGVRLRSAAGELGPISAHAGVDATTTPEKIDAALAGCRVELANSSRLVFDGSFAMPRDGRLVATLAGSLGVHAEALTRIVPEIDVVRTRGTFGLDLPAATLSLVEGAVSVDDREGRKLVEGSVSTVKPLVVDLHGFAPRWTEFEPDELRLKVDGFPIAWLSRYIPQIAIKSGTLHGSLNAKVAPDRSVRIAGDVPFEVRETDLLWGDIPVLTDAHLQVSPSIVLSQTAIEAELSPIAYRDKLGNRFDGAIDVLAKPGSADAAFKVDFRASLPSLTERIGNLGDFEAHAAGTFAAEARALNVTSATFDSKDPDGRSYLKGTSLQPFTVGIATFTVTPSGDSSDLFRTKFIPLEIEKLFPEALGFTLTGPLPSGEAVISAHEGGLLFHAPKPLEFDPVTVNRNGAPFLDRVRFSVLPEVAYTAKGLRSRETLIRISSAGKPIASIATRGVFDIAGQHPERTLETTVDAQLPALFDQPVGRGLPGFDRGALAASWRVTLGSSRQTEIRIALSKPVRRDGLVAPDLDAQLRLDQEADGGIRIDAPIRLKTPERTSDVSARGVFRAERGENMLELALDSDRFVVDDVARLVDAFMPQDTASHSKTKSDSTLLSQFGAPDGVALWDRLHGRVPIRFRSIEFDRYALEDAHATLVSTSTKLGVEELGASFLGARLGGRAAFTFDAAGTPPYAVDGDFEVADLDLGRIFTTVDPSRPPTLEGRFRLDGEIQGAGPDPAMALREGRGELRVEGTDAVFRGLGPEAKSASRLVKAAGALTFSKELRAVGRLIGTLQALPVHEARVKLLRDPARGLVVDSLDLRADDLLVHGTGTIRRAPSVPFVDRKLNVDVALAARGDAAIVFRGLDLLGEKTDEGDYRPLTRTLSVGGTVGEPDAGALWEMFDEAAAQAKGSFGLALRKAMKLVSR